MWGEKRFEGKLQMRGKMRNKLSLTVEVVEMSYKLLWCYSSEESDKNQTQLIMFIRLKEDVRIKEEGGRVTERFLEQDSERYGNFFYQLGWREDLQYNKGLLGHEEEISAVAGLFEERHSICELVWNYRRLHDATSPEGQMN